jgi:hypothetical protein
MRKDRRERLSGDRGVVLIAAAGLVFVLLAFVGLAFDVGYLQWQRRRAQSAADGGAMAGAWARVSGQGIEAKGRQGSSMNGFTHATDGITVTINNPPTSGAYQGDATAVEAIVSQDAPSFFSNFWWSSLPVRARAVAKLGYDGACVYALNTSDSHTLDFSGGAQVTLGCGAINFSDHDSATRLTGNSNITLTNGSTVASVGDHEQNGGGTITGGTFADGVNRPTDPLGGLPMPDPTLAPYSTMTRYYATDVAAIDSAGGSLNPGVYCGGIQLNGGTTVNLNPGMYILAGQGLQFNSTTVNGNGVTFYNTTNQGDVWNCPSMTGNNNAGPIQINSTADVDLIAPENDANVDSAYIGVLMFQNRDITYNQTNNINGGSNSNFDGALYFPTTDLSFSGNGDTAGYIMLIADTVNFTGTSAMTLNDFPDAFATNNPIFKKWVTMAE